jgi:hypothetical protein
VNNFFFNVFETFDQAVAANALAANFVAQGVLKNQIQKVEFETAIISFDVKQITFCALGTEPTLITRHWQLRNNATLTTPQVVETFRTGFGPIVDQMPGFVEYEGALVNATDTYFQNFFNGAANAVAAQNAAYDFVFGAGQSGLGGQIEKVAFNEGPVQFVITNDPGCFANDQTNFYISTRWWVLQPAATLTVQQVSDYFRAHFAPTITTQVGFRAYASMIPTADAQHNFFFNIFETPEQAQAANALAAEFVANSPLATQIEKVEFLAATIEFDIKTSAGSGILKVSSLITALVVALTIVVGLF